MKKSKLLGMEDNGQSDNLHGNAPMVVLHDKVASYERERKILLELSGDITRIREKNDLITLFSLRIKKLFYFTHTIVTLIDHEAETYTPFLLDHDAGIREILMMPLKSKNETVGFLHIYSDRDDRFSSDFQSITHFVQLFLQILCIEACILKINVGLLHSQSGTTAVKTITATSFGRREAPFFDMMKRVTR